MKSISWNVIQISVIPLLNTHVPIKIIINPHFGRNRKIKSSVVAYKVDQNRSLCQVMAPCQVMALNNNSVWDVSEVDDKTGDPKSSI